MHIKWRPEHLYDSNLSKYNAMARIQGTGCVEDHQCLVETTHFDDEDDQL